MMRVWEMLDSLKYIVKEKEKDLDLKNLSNLVFEEFNNHKYPMSSEVIK